MQGNAVPAIERESDYVRTRAGGLIRGIVLRSVIDNDEMRVGKSVFRVRHNTRNHATFVVSRYDDIGQTIQNSACQRHRGRAIVWRYEKVPVLVVLKGAFGCYRLRMVLKIRQVGEEVLRHKARPLSTHEILDRSIQELIESMRETMHDAPGVGLAAPQIGYSLQIVVIEDKAEFIQKLPPEQVAQRERKPVPFHVLINPKLTLLQGDAAEFFEGCLSVAGFTAVVPRAKQVRVECLNDKAEPVIIDATGWYARILQHEIDHLNGVLYLDRMNSRTFCTHDNHARYWKDRS